METSKPKKVINIIVSILAALISSAAVFFLCIMLFFSIGLFGWSDGGEKKELERLEKTSNITFWISIVIALAVGIYILYSMNKSKLSNKDSFLDSNH